MSLSFVPTGYLSPDPGSMPSFPISHVEVSFSVLIETVRWVNWLICVSHCELYLLVSGVFSHFGPLWFSCVLWTMYHPTNTLCLLSFNHNMITHSTTSHFFCGCLSTPASCSHEIDKFKKNSCSDSATHCSLKKKPWLFVYESSIKDGGDLINHRKLWSPSTYTHQHTRCRNLKRNSPPRFI